MVDADPAGCGTGPGFLRGAVPEGFGLTALMTSTDKAHPSFDLFASAVAVDVTQRRLLVPGFADATRAAAFKPVWPLQAEAFAQTSGDGVDVLVDVGRLASADSAAPLFQAADLVVVVARSSLTSVTGARSAIRQLRQLSGRGGAALPLQVLLVGSGRPHSVREIERSLGISVPATLAWDPASAEVLSDGASAGWLFWRSPLMRSARVAARRFSSLATSGSAPSEIGTVRPADGTLAAVRSWGGRRARVRPVSGEQDRRVAARSGVFDE